MKKLIAGLGIVAVLGGAFWIFEIRSDPQLAEVERNLAIKELAEFWKEVEREERGLPELAAPGDCQSPRFWQGDIASPCYQPPVVCPNGGTCEAEPRLWTNNRTADRSQAIVVQ
ncbi:MAG: hypothetical protein ACFB11_18735 [Paracoccaceae bacterium]